MNWDEAEIERGEVEAVLETWGAGRPSARLDARMAGFFSRGGRWWPIAGPLAGFAAGVVVTASIAVGTWPAPRAEVAAGAPKMVAKLAAAADPAATMVFVGEAHPSTVQLEGTLEGMPVMVQHTHTAFTAARSRSSLSESGEVVLTDSVRIVPAYGF